LAHGLRSAASLPPLLRLLRTLLLQHPALVPQTLPILDDLLLGLGTLEESDAQLVAEALLSPLLVGVLGLETGGQTQDRALVGADAMALVVLGRLCKSVGLGRLLPLLGRCWAAESSTALAWPARAAIAKVNLIEGVSRLVS
jgi:hypothetical protein